MLRQLLILFHFFQTLLMGNFISTCCHNRSFEDIYNLDAAQNESELDTSGQKDFQFYAKKYLHVNV